MVFNNAYKYTNRCTLMSTKDMRFILLILPYLCLISFLINNIRNKYCKIYKLF